MKAVEKNEEGYSGNALVCAKALRSLGWSPEDIDKILAGPQRSSIHGIAGLPVEAWSVETVEATAVPDLTGDPSTPVSPSPKDDAAPADAGVGQKNIAD